MQGLPQIDQMLWLLVGSALLPNWAGHADYNIPGEIFSNGKRILLVGHNERWSMS